MLAFLNIYFLLSLTIINGFQLRSRKCSNIGQRSYILTSRSASIFKNVPNSSINRSLPGLRPKVSTPMFEFNKNNEVIIESPSMNTRRITSSILVDGTIDEVWRTLTDYNNLAVHIPNLVKSYIVNSPSNTVRIFQEGAQKIIGFDFRASLVMEMIDRQSEDENSVQKMKRLGFKLVESAMFSNFDGEWTLRTHSRIRTFDTTTKMFYYRYKTQLTYSVFIRPKGPVPVVALEWRIREDVPINLAAMKAAVENSNRNSLPPSAGGNGASGGQYENAAPFVDWGTDETLGAYI
eukprot:gene9646-20047_t